MVQTVLRDRFIKMYNDPPYYVPFFYNSLRDPINNIDKASAGFGLYSIWLNLQTKSMWMNYAFTGTANWVQINIPGNNSPPNSGDWVAGNKFYNSNPKPGEFIGWICVESGSPGVWKGFGLIEV